jgi:NAD(P)-dependent dehydrogenase (short-subunit alcohol dehydrogenase family)
VSVIAIAGAGGGLGPVVVKRLKDDGHTVAGIDRNVDALQASGVDDGQAVDLLDPAAAKAWAQSLVERYGQVDALVHLVGGWRGGRAIDDTPEEDWDFLRALLIDTVRHASSAFLPHLRASGGRFLLVSSSQAQRPDAMNAPYAAAKAAAETWTLAMARDLAAHGGTANVLIVHAIGDKETFTPAADLAEAIAFQLGAHGGRMNGQRLALHG